MKTKTAIVGGAAALLLLLSFAVLAAAAGDNSPMDRMVVSEPLRDGFENGKGDISRVLEGEPVKTQEQERTRNGTCSMEGEPVKTQEQERTQNGTCCAFSGDNDDIDKGSELETLVSESDTPGDQEPDGRLKQDRDMLSEGKGETYRNGIGSP